MRLHQAILALFFSGAFNYSALAVDATMAFNGDLVNPPCTINGGAAITVPFDKVVITQIDGSYKKKLVDYTLDCTATIPLSMKITGAPSAFSSTGTIQTSVTDLGIQLLAGTTPITLNSAWTFNPAVQPVLYAVPVKRSGSTLAPQPFSASATMTVDYP